MQLSQVLFRIEVDKTRSLTFLERLQEPVFHPFIPLKNNLQWAAVNTKFFEMIEPEAKEKQTVVNC